MSMSPAQAPILVIDDSDEDLFFFKHMLRKAGVMNPCQAIVGANSLYVLLSASADHNGTVERPLACFVDIEMDGTSGFEVLTWIRNQSALSTLPVIMLSVSDDPRDVRKSAKLGAQCYLTKYPATSGVAAVVNDADLFPLSPRAMEKPYNLFASLPS